MEQADARTEIFRSSWSLYDAILGWNYMFHREIEVAVRAALRPNSPPHDYALLDLGCGNARGLVALLRDAPPRRYVGVDLSRPALDQAAEVLRELPAVELREQDMLACVEEFAGAGTRFEVIHSAFALHHLSSSDKARLFQALARTLTPGGVVVLVDVVRDARQSREAYLEAYLGMVQTEWRALTAEQVTQVRDHVQAYDFPETLETLATTARAAGLDDCRVLGAYRQHHVLQFQVSPTSSPRAD